MDFSRLLTGAAVTALLLSGCGQATETTPEPAATAPSTAQSSAATEQTPAAAPSTPRAESTVKDADKAEDEGAAKPAKTYLTLAECEASEDCKSSERVLFFHAPWCPSCKATEESLSMTAPSGFTVVKVDYDTQTDLKKKYGITQQHTFVSVNGAGEKQKVWTG